MKEWEMFTCTTPLKSPSGHILGSNTVTNRVGLSHRRDKQLRFPLSAFHPFLCIVLFCFVKNEAHTFLFSIHILCLELCAYEFSLLVDKQAIQFGLSENPIILRFFMTHSIFFFIIQNRCYPQSPRNLLSACLPYKCVCYYLEIWTQRSLQQQWERRSCWRNQAASQKHLEAFKADSTDIVSLVLQTCWIMQETQSSFSSWKHRKFYSCVLVLNLLAPSRWFLNLQLKSGLDRNSWWLFFFWDISHLRKMLWSSFPVISLEITDL